MTEYVATPVFGTQIRFLAVQFVPKIEISQVEVNLQARHAREHADEQPHPNEQSGTSVPNYGYTSIASRSDLRAFGFL